MSDETLRPEENPSSEEETFGSNLYFWLQALVMALVSLILLSMFVGRIIHVDGSSMLPTFHHGDMLLLQSLGYEPKPGDVVVLTKDSFMEGRPIVKRVIAVAGQRVDIDYDSDVVWVDGQPLDEPYINEQDMRLPSADSITHMEVPEGCVFVMGDNRNDSSDSRRPVIGAVDTRCVLGGVKLILLPFHHFGVVESISQIR